MVKLFSILLSIAFSISLFSCSGDKKEDSYSGVSDLIASRNKARYSQAEHSKNRDEENSVSEQSSDEKAEFQKIKTPSLTKEKVKITDYKSGKTIATAIAYINQNGEVVSVKILKD